MKYAIIFGSIVGVLLIVGIIATVIIISNKSKTTIILVADYSKFGLVNSDSSLKTSKLIVKDPSTFGTEGQLPVYATSVAKPSGSTRTGGVTRSLQETSAQSSMTIVDESTSTTVTTFSNGLDMKVGIDFSSVLETVLANQAQLVQETEVSEASTSPATTNLMSSGDQKTVEQPENKQFVFYEVVDKLTAILKKEIAKMDPKSKVDQAVCHDMKYNKEKSALEFTPTSNAEPPQTVPFFDPSMIPQIKDFTNETEVAEAAASIVLKIIAKSKEFFSKNIQKLQ